MDIHINTLQELANAAPEIVAYAGGQKIFLFHGDMGAGKTTLIKSLCAAVGVTDEVTSPTFSIVNEYASPAGPVYHFDFYRLKNGNEALDMGYEEYFFSDRYCFIEWPEKIAGLIPETYTSVRIIISVSGERQITVENI